MDTLLPQFDAGDISNYDLAGHAWCYYNRVHVEQLRYLHDVTGNPRFQEYADQFEGYAADLGEC